MRELLKEAARELGAVQYYIPPADETVEMVPAITADVDACQKLANRIDAELAKPAPEFDKFIEKILDLGWKDGEFPEDGNRYKKEAAALIESRRVVPRALLEACAQWGNDEHNWGRHPKGCETLTEIAAKYGVEVEG